MPQNHAGTQTNRQVQAAAKMPRWSRDNVVDCVARFEQQRVKGISQREFCRRMATPRTSLQHWLARKATLDADPALVAFFESSTGLAFLHRLVIAAHVVFSFLGTCGNRLIGRFLREAGLGPFVATSVGSQNKVAGRVERTIGDYGDEQRAALGATMSPQAITACQDETFHPNPCLVAIEPVSNFILLERYDTKRDAATWDAHMSEALAGLPVEVVQSTSDEAKGLLAHVRKGLGAHHSPDLFHVQHALGGALARPLARAVCQADAQLEAAQRAVADVDAQRGAWEAKPRGPGRAPDFESRRRMAQARAEGAQKNRDIALRRQEQGRQAIRGLGDDYHPVDLTTGKVRPLPDIKKSLEAHFESARALVEQGAVPERATVGINKAARVLPAMVATLAFFFNAAADAIAALGLEPADRQQAVEVLLPATYLAVAAKKGRSAKERRRMAELAEALRRQAYAAAPKLRAESVTHTLLVCARMFQRASSCVEGRNGQLDLRHHSLHRITDSRLKALTTTHNYAVEDADKTTPAERFFGAKPNRSLVDYVADRVALPARPAAHRASPKQEVLRAA